MPARKPLVLVANGLAELPAADFVGIGQGGTGANTAAGALSTLGAYPSNNPSGYIAASGAPVQSVAGKTGAVTLAVGDVSGAYASSNPAGYQTASNVSTALAPYALTTSLPPASNATPLADGSGTPGTSAAYAREGHVHPTDTSRYAASNPSGYITSAGAPVQSFAGRTGAVTLSSADVTGALGFAPVNKAGDTMGVLTVPALGANGTLSGSNWQNQGGYLGWNITLGGGETDFVNSRGGGAGGFNWYNVASAANAAAALVMSLSSAGALTLTTALAVSSGGTGATTTAGALSSLGAYPSSNPSGYIAASGAPVQSVAGRTGAVTLAVADVSGALSASAAASTYLPFTGGGITGVTSIGVATSGDFAGSNNPQLLVTSPTASGGNAMIAFNCNGQYAAKLGVDPAGYFVIGGWSMNARVLTLDGFGNLTLKGGLSLATPLAVSSGGTGATSATAALSNLGGYAASNPAGYIAASGAPVQSVAGRTGAVTLGVGDVSGALSATNGNATNLNQDFLYLSGNLGSNPPTIPNGLAAAGWNYSAGSGEMDFFCGYGPASTSFAWYQKLSATSVRLLMSLSPTGQPAFAQPVPVASGGTGSSTASGALASLGGYAANNPAGYIAASGAPVQSVAGRTGAVTLAVADVSGALPAATAASTYAPLNGPSFTGPVTLGTNGSYPINIGTTGQYFGSNVQFNAGFKYIGSDYAWWWRADGASGVSFHTAPSGTAGAAITDTVAINVSPTGVVTLPVNPLGVASGGTGAATAAAGLANLGGYPSSNPSGYITSAGAPVQSVAGRTGAVTLAVADVSGAAPLANPNFTGTVSAATINTQTLTTRAAPTAPLNWQTQGASVGWNFSNGGGEMDFINSRGLGAGGFNWYNTDSSANATPSLVMSLSPTGALTLTAPLAVSSGGTGGTTAAAALSNLGALSATTAAATYAPISNPAFTGTVSVAATRINDGNLPIQINAPAGGAAYLGANKSGGYGLLVGYDQTFGGGVVRQVTTDPLLILVNSTTTALTITSSTAATFAGPVSMPDLNVAGSGTLAGAWTSYTATVTAGSGTVGTSSATVRYKKLGRTVWFNLAATVAAGSGGTSINVSLPFTNGSASVMLVSRDLTSINLVSGYIAGGGTSLGINSVSTGGYPVPMGGSAQFAFSGTYEAAA